MFTPSLGLIDTLHHGRMGSLQINTDRSKYAFDKLDNGLSITFQNVWEPFTIGHVSDFLDIPVIGVAFILASIGFFHICANSLILRLTSQNLTISRLIIHGVQSIICPPLHLDWELHYRDNDRHISVIKSWQR